ncbi:hypothetical protein BO78DRAFT_133539 [Aspergillus sclerotiicarbonarius CBS 121057]|uniref:Uncharacterized protein n=1 Tax=Aspergillus sclerotiicarbonarius (strain CBS 121057 / IBT 28362) TaxID=1448318 RepID=A0A319F133_ASPSB|nr:hypothetical protein BO78DRAFT_133539 [Aspergillus sclerotiicarbonarius CBS 121057]
MPQPRFTADGLIADPSTCLSEGRRKPSNSEYASDHELQSSTPSARTPHFGCFQLHTVPCVWDPPYYVTMKYTQKHAWRSGAYLLFHHCGVRIDAFLLRDLKSCHRIRVLQLHPDCRGSLESLHGGYCCRSNQFTLRLAGKWQSEERHTSHGLPDI